MANAYLKWHHPQEAISLYREVLQDHPNNGWALYPLEKSLLKLRKNKEAILVKEEFSSAWSRADIPAPIFLFKLT